MGFRYVLLLTLTFLMGAVYWFGWQSTVAEKRIPYLSKTDRLVPDLPPPSPLMAAAKTPDTSSIPKADAEETAMAPDAEADPDEALLELTDGNPDYPTFADRVQEVMARRNGEVFDLRALWDASRQEEGWAAAQDTPEAPELSDAERQDGREFIQVNPLKIESLVPGDRLTLPINQIGQRYAVRIDNVRVQSGNAVTWTGHLEDVDQDHTVVITRGDTLIMAGITTPQGHFEMQARGDQGWIASSATLFKGGDEIVAVPQATN
ncbi:MAG: hypothetical protein IPM37_00340 [Hahellaceae bacterium]|jgi:hypothetical protein|nr:hypothetical protein [Hahellaceae bacterium]